MLQWIKSPESEYRKKKNLGLKQDSHLGNAKKMTSSNFSARLRYLLSRKEFLDPRIGRAALGPHLCYPSEPTQLPQPRLQPLMLPERMSTSCCLLIPYTQHPSHRFLVSGMKERGLLGKRRRARRIPCDRKQRKRENFSHCQKEK